MRKLRVLVLMHEDLVPPDDPSEYSAQEQYDWKTEYSVIRALEGLGHEVRKLGLSSDLKPLRDTIQEESPHIVFNLLEEFRGEALLDMNVVAYLELLGVPYTGCSPRGMLLARDKALSRKILSYHRIHQPQFAVFRQGRKITRAKRLSFPLIVKSVSEDASLGISQASIVRNDDDFAERVRFIHEKVGTDAIAEQYIEGREIYVGILGETRLRVLPPQELIFKKKGASEGPLIATARVKHNVKYQKRWGVALRVVDDLPAEAARRLERLSKRIYRLLELRGYARIDFRMAEEGRFYFLEANPNPDIAPSEEFAAAAKEAGLSYKKLIQAILNVGLQRGRTKREG